MRNPSGSRTTCIANVTPEQAGKLYAIINACVEHLLPLQAQPKPGDLLAPDDGAIIEEWWIFVCAALKEQEQQETLDLMRGDAEHFTSKFRAKEPFYLGDIRKHYALDVL